MTGDRRVRIMLYIGASHVPVAIKTLGFGVSWRANRPNIPLMRIVASGDISRRRRAQRPRSVSLIRNVSRLPVCSAIEYERENSHSLSDHMNETNCPGILLRSSVSSITSFSVTGLRYVFSTILASYHDEVLIASSSNGTKSALVTPQSGQHQSSGISENSVPAFIPSASSHRAGS